MALSFNNQSGNKNLFNIIGMVVIVLLLGVGTYFLFFAPQPLVEVVIPTELESISKLSEVDLNKGLLADDPTYKLLGPKVGGIEPSNVGRDNPFARF